MSIVNCTKLMSGYLCLQRRLSQFLKALRSLIGSSHFVNLFQHYVATVLTLHSLQTEVEVIAANPST